MLCAPYVQMQLVNHSFLSLLNSQKCSTAFTLEDPRTHLHITITRLLIKATLALHTGVWLTCQGACDSNPGVTRASPKEVLGNGVYSETRVIKPWFQLFFCFQKQIFLYHFRDLSYLLFTKIMSCIFFLRYNQALSGNHMPTDSSADGYTHRCSMKLG